MQCVDRMSAKSCQAQGRALQDGCTTLTPQENCQYERHRCVRAILGPVTAFHASMREMTHWQFTFGCDEGGELC